VRISTVMLLALFVMGMAACPKKNADSIYMGLAMKWLEEHPDQEKIPEDVAAELWSKANAQAKREADALVSGGGKVAVDAATGNYVGAGAGLLGLLLVALGIGAKAKGVN